MDTASSTQGLMPAVFIGHGSPMNTLETNRYTSTWRAFGASVPRPRAVLCVSAHWYVNFTAVTAMPQPRTIHDFFGFPEELFAVQYPAPGSATIAQEVADVVKPTRVGLDRDSWGIDHGTWSVLVHMFPKADVPVLQLALDQRKGIDYHFELATRLAALRERGILIVGSGNVVHNLRMLDWAKPEHGFDWAHRFDEAAREIATERPHDVGTLEAHADYARAVPTPDHFLPFVYALGVAQGSGRPAKILIDGYAMGSLSMTCYTVGCDNVSGAREAGPAATVPDPGVVPPEQTNI